jgi:isoquinoline 1-oxidoreductase beta subunit
MVRLADLLASETGDRLFERGDYASAIDGSRPLSATYSIAPTPHQSLEAPAAVARFSRDRLDVWTGSQVPELARAAAAKAANLPERDVTLYPMPVGDGSGAAMGLDAVTIAVALARHTNRPVSLAFPPATAQNHDAVRPPVIAKVSALPSPGGTIAAWSSRIAGMASLDAALARATNGNAPAYSPRGATPPYGFESIRISAIDAGPVLKAGYMRGGDEASLTFVTESFIDEMARAMGAEPLAFRVGMLGGAPRLARVLSTAAAIGGWDGGARGSHMGIACATLYGSHIGLLAEASISADQRVTVSRLVAAVDAGRIVNPGLVRQQVEGSLMAALAAATVPAPEWVAGMPKAAPLRGKGFERLADVPRIEVELIRTDNSPGGVSGLGMAVLAPAVANAIAAGTGKRLRNLPFDPMGTA